MFSRGLFAFTIILLLGSPASAGEVRLANLALPTDADIRREAPLDFVAEAKPELDIVDAGADAPLPDALGCEVDLGRRLQDQRLCDQEVVFGLEASRKLAFVADEGGGIDFEPIGCMPRAGSVTTTTGPG